MVDPSPFSVEHSAWSIHRRLYRPPGPKVPGKAPQLQVHQDRPQPTVRAAGRTAPFQLACQAVTACWDATAGHDPADVAEHRNRGPLITTKAQPSTADMAAKLRRVLIAARFKASRPDQPTPHRPSRPAVRQASPVLPGCSRGGATEAAACKRASAPVSRATADSIRSAITAGKAGGQQDRLSAVIVGERGGDPLTPYRGVLPGDPRRVADLGEHPAARARRFFS